MQTDQEMLKYAQAYMKLLNKGYTDEHLMSLPKIVRLPEDIMMNEILPHLDYQDIITVCSSSHEYYKKCEKHHIFKNLQSLGLNKNKITIYIIYNILTRI